MHLSEVEIRRLAEDLVKWIHEDKDEITATYYNSSVEDFIQYIEEVLRKVNGNS